MKTRTLLRFSLIASLAFGASVKTYALPYTPGDVFVSYGPNLFPREYVREYSPSGAIVQTLDTGPRPGEGTPGEFGFLAGSAFDSAGGFYVTKEGTGGVLRFDGSGNFLGDFGTGYPVQSVSLLFTQSGNVFVGSGGGDVIVGFEGSNILTERTSTGALIQNFTLATQSNGIPFFDLAADLHTMYYTSAGNQIKRFDIASNTQLSDFTTLPDLSTTDIRILPDGGLLAAGAVDTYNGIVYRVNSAGAVVQTYMQGSSLIGGLSLDKDGTSFWAADGYSGLVENIDIASGSVLHSFYVVDDLGNSAWVTGLSVFGETIVSNPFNPSPTNSAVPEPSTYGIFGVAGLAGLAYLRSRKNRATKDQKFRSGSEVEALELGGRLG